MKHISLNEELMNQLRLIKYDRSKTLLEQGGLIPDEGQKYEWQKSKNYDPKEIEPAEIQPTWSDDYKDAERQRKQIEDYKKYVKNACNTKLYGLKTPDEKIAKEVYLLLSREISSSGTEEEDILNVLKKIKNKETYQKILEIFYTCFPSSVGQNLIQLIQGLEFSKGSFLSKYEKDSNFTKYIQYEKNDKWLEAYQNILQKFNKDEVYDVEYNIKEKDLDINLPDNVNIALPGLEFYLNNKKSIEYLYKEAFPPFVREVAHLALPLLSFALIFLPGGQLEGAASLASFIRWSSFALEAFDASIYQFADKDTYLAGLTLMFAFIAPAELAISRQIKIYGPAILRSISLRQFKFTDEEIRLLADLAANSRKYNQIAKSEMVNAWMENTVKIWGKNLNKSNFLTTYAKMINVSKSLGKTLANFTVMIGGVTFTWDMIASKLLGIKCKTFSIGEMFALIDESLEKYGDYFQPFTIKEGDGCEDKMKKVLFNEMLKEETLLKYKLKNHENLMYYMLLKLMMEKKITLNDQMGKTYNKQVVAIQNILSSLGLSNELSTTVKIENGTFFIENNNIYKKIRILNSFGTLLKEINVENKKSYKEKFDTKGNKIFIVGLYYNNTEKNILKIFDTKNYNVITDQMKCGFFDFKTKEIIVSYQKKNNLTLDGVVGENTIKSLIKSVENLGSKIEGSCEIDANMKKSTKEPTIKKVVETVYVTQKELEGYSNDELYKLASDSLKQNWDYNVDLLKKQKENGPYTQQQLDSLENTVVLDFE